MIAYTSSTIGVNISLESGNFGINISATNIEGLYGSNYADKIRAKAGEENIIDGGGGADEITGGQRDTLRGGSGSDLIIIDPNESADFLTTVSGGAGDDYIKAENFNTVVQFGIGDGHDTLAVLPDDEFNRPGVDRIEFIALSISDLKVIFNVTNTYTDPLHDREVMDGDFYVVIKSTGDSICLTEKGSIGSFFVDPIEEMDIGDPNTFNFMEFTGTPIFVGGAEVDLRKIAAYGGFEMTSFSHKDALEKHYIEAGNGTNNDDLRTGTNDGDDYQGLGGQDTLDGAGGNDLLAGWSGDDIIRGGSGDDTIDGGTGDDSAQYALRLTDYSFTRQSDGRVVVTALLGGEGTDTLVGIETLHFDQDSSDIALVDIVGNYGTLSDDNVFGTAIENQLYGRSGQDVLAGLEDDDMLDGGDGFDQATFFGSSTDFAAFRNADGTVTISDPVGNEGTDTLVNIEQLYFVGDDVGMGIDDLVGGYGTQYEDVIFGSGNADNLYGLEGDDTLMGFEGNDQLDGGEGEDLAEFLGATTDYTFYRNANGSVHIQALATSEGTDTVKNVEAFYFESDEAWIATRDLVGDYGTIGSDAWLAGTSGADRLYGLAGDDEFMSYEGDDEIFGGDGNDQVDFLGAFADFTITYNTNGSVSVADNINQEGTDTLWEVESVYFATSDTWLML